MVPEIWSATDRIYLLFYFCCFTPLKPMKIKIFKKLKKKKKKNTLKDFNILHMRNINDNHMMYGSWDMKCNKQNFLSFRVMFCPFTPLTSQKITIFLKMTTPGDIIILHKCTINDNHMIYGFRDMKCNSQNILWFWAIFCHFTPLTTQKIKILKKKITWRYHHFTQVYQKSWSYTIMFLW